MPQNKCEHTDRQTDRKILKTQAILVSGKMRHGGREGEGEDEKGRGTTAGEGEGGG